MKKRPDCGILDIFKSHKTVIKKETRKEEEEEEEEESPAS